MLSRFISRLLYRWTANRPVKFITINGAPYLERYYLGEALGLVFYLHRYVGSDSERALHDHPFRWSAGLVLTGHYVEERMRHLDPRSGPVSRRRKVRPFLPNFITSATFHRITYAAPGTWTLFAHTDWSKEWGFMEYDQFRCVTFYHQPQPMSQGRLSWRDTAPRGATSGRMPLTTTTGA